MALAGLAVAATVFWILWGADSTPRSKHFISTPQFILWVLILCGLSALLVLAAWPVTVILRRLVSDLRAGGGLDRLTWLSFGTGCVVLIGLLALPLYLRYFPWSSTLADDVPTGHEWPLWRHTPKFVTVTTATILVAAPAVGGIWLVGVALGRMSSEDHGTQLHGKQLERFFALRNDFNVLLAISAALLGLTMFASAALRSAVAAAEPPGYDFGFILAFGLWLSGLLGLACAPTYVAFRGAGMGLVDTAYPLLAAQSAELAETLEKRQALERLLGLSLTASVVVRAGAAIASPFIGSLVGLLIPD